MLPLFLAAVAYFPILNNDFIADDYVVSENADALKADPLHLFRIPPENFRTTIHVTFGLLKAVAGYNATLYYAFNIALHATNILLLGYFLRLLAADPRVVFLATSFFAVLQAPQEAVMWLSGMTESLLAFFILLTLISWTKGRPILATFCFVGALFSKESAVVVLAAIPLLQIYRGKRPFTREYGLLLIPTVLAAIIFLATWKTNPMISFGLHKISGNALLVLGKSLHRLLWPWFYVLLFLNWLAVRSLTGWKTVGLLLGVVLLLMSPYMFITYGTALPSRNLYLASAALMTLFAVMVAHMKRSPLATVFVIVFISFNIGYLWIRKDPQYVERAVPTTELLKALKNHRPERILVLGFPYANVEIARAAAMAAPGWNHDLVVIDVPPSECSECPRLVWDARLGSYEEREPQ